MKTYLVLAFFVSLMAVNACTAPISQSAGDPSSDLGHIDIILDAETWYAIKKDTFIQRELGILEIDTTIYGGKPSYDLYLLGALNFLHLSLAKDFWANQQGGGALVFQSRKPGEKESLLKAWKVFYTDSLDVHTFKGNDFTLDEVMAWYSTDSTIPKTATFFANLTSYSAGAYRKWGISDSIVNAGLAMTQFMSDWGGEALKTRLFKKITELHMTLNQKEFKEVRSALLAIGYKENKEKFTQPSNPSIYIRVMEKKPASKYSKVGFQLNRPVATKEIVFSSLAKLEFRGDQAWFLFSGALADQ